ncbi:uncharacterized protein M437DRAFT_64220 [Aureobasidium melanogenum CBS 110374]|uniref:Uncharacterized protein n=1 Tax=Aureobasidium melanogenum (strain CBS 110374) TaxID=1043003 RepID=A0A074VUX6_AURM1|nr:uncharacterized protein M437DRAFT_64220 [Aureobasidium melanogenum CBS 110374]KEQ64575.1 hypothetical protein M437DRAFT_64220 [Aureobasidium melanogenum CBS 110374]
MAMSTDTIIALVSLLVGLVGLPPTILILWHCIQRCMRPSTSHEASDVGSGVLYLAVVRDLLLTRTHRARSEIDLIIIAVYGPCHCTLKGVFPDYTLEILKVVFVTHEFVPDYRVKVGVMSKGVLFVGSEWLGVETQCSCIDASECQSDHLLRDLAQRDVESWQCSIWVTMLSLWTRLDPFIRQTTRSWTTIRLFSYTRTGLDAPKDGKDTHHDASDAARLAYAREYYHRVTKKKLEEDPKFRAAKLKNLQEYREQCKKRMEEDADFRTKILQRREEYHLIRYQDHDFAEQKRKISRERQRLLRATSKVVWDREHMRKALRERRLRDDALYIKHRFIGWLRRNFPKQNLEWRKHQPTFFDEKVEMHCASCRRLRPLKLWWKRKPVSAEAITDTEQFDCMLCFFKHAGDDLMPIGYEGLTFERPTAVKHRKK